MNHENEPFDRYVLINSYNTAYNRAVLIKGEMKYVIALSSKKEANILYLWLKQILT